MMGGAYVKVVGNACHWTSEAMTRHSSRVTIGSLLSHLRQSMLNRQPKVAGYSMNSLIYPVLSQVLKPVTLQNSESSSELTKDVQTNQIST